MSKQQKKTAESITILLLDDSKDRQAVTQTVLEGAGIRAVIRETDPLRALEILREHVVDIVLVEYRMAKLDGVEFVRMVRHSSDSVNSRIPVIVQTAEPTQPLVEAARDAGVHEFLVRPFSSEQVARHINGVLRKPRDFVEVFGFTGPDRRRLRNPYRGPERRTNR